MGYHLVFNNYSYGLLAPALLSLATLCPITSAQAESHLSAPEQTAPAENSKLSKTVNDPLLSPPPAPERGWKGLARALEVISPSVDTSEPLDAAQASERISQLLAQGKNEQALTAIENRQQAREQNQEPGTDVQLLFLQARALAALDRHNEAIRIYQDMTTYYPELPEPWNNLAAEYIAQDKLDMALDALKMALTADPSYALARSNMGEVQLLLANQAYQEAASSGSSRARTRAQQTLKILQQ